MYIVGAKLIHAERRTDMRKRTGTFRDLANRPHIYFRVTA